MILNVEWYLFGRWVTSVLLFHLYVIPVCNFASYFFICISFWFAEGSFHPPQGCLGTGPRGVGSDRSCDPNGSVETLVTISHTGLSSWKKGRVLILEHNVNQKQIPTLMTFFWMLQQT